MLLLLAACGTLGLESNVPVTESGRAYIDIEPNGRVEFPDTSPSGRSAASEVAVTNEGGAAAIVEDAWIEGEASGAFSLEGLRVPTRIEPGESTTFTVRFLPDAPGLHEGTLVVLSAEGAYVERLLLGSGCEDANGDGTC